jgi:altronate dehydratase small subunit
MARGLANGAQRTERMPSAFIVLSAEDNVGVAIKHIAPGSDVAAGHIRLTALDEVPMGHKIALRPIGVGQKIVKFGVPVGSATKEIAAGAHVHMHNVKSDYLTNRMDYHE